jgi:S1-C subfamily serine protease
MYASSVGRIWLRGAIVITVVVFIAGCRMSGRPLREEIALLNSTVVPQVLPAPTSVFTTQLTDVVARVCPAVVQVTSEQMVQDPTQGNMLEPIGVGSGFIYDAEGHILTNSHVVEGASDLVVSLTDGRSFPAKLIGHDPQTDLAVVQIDARDLPVAKLGDSTRLKVGDWVIAIGNALALPGGPTVTAGLVSALDRTIQEPGDGQGQGPYLFSLIQTDAPINPGNSGGPLLNLAGDVVGINTLTIGQVGSSSYAQDVGFAIAIATAKPIADQLVATGNVAHPYLGADYVPYSPALAARYGLEASYGIVVTNVAVGSPAEQAGIQARDLILDANNNPLNRESALAEILHQHRPGDLLSMTVLRGSQRRKVQVRLGAQLSP